MSEAGIDGSGVCVASKNSGLSEIGMEIQEVFGNDRLETVGLSDGFITAMNLPLVSLVSS